VRGNLGFLHELRSHTKHIELNCLKNFQFLLMLQSRPDTNAKTKKNFQELELGELKRIAIKKKTVKHPNKLFLLI